MEDPRRGGYLSSDDEAPYGQHAALPQDVEEQLAHRQRELALEESGDGRGRERSGDDEDPPHAADSGDRGQDREGCGAGCPGDFFGDVGGGIICARSGIMSGGV